MLFVECVFDSMIIFDTKMSIKLQDFHSIKFFLKKNIDCSKLELIIYCVSK